MIGHLVKAYNEGRTLARRGEALPVLAHSEGNQRTRLRTQGYLDERDRMSREGLLPQLTLALESGDCA